MPDIIPSSRFTRQLRKLIKRRPDLEKVIKQKILQLQNNPRVSGLYIHKLSGSHNWSLRIEEDIRIILHWQEDKMFLIGIGSHDQVY